MKMFSQQEDWHPNSKSQIPQEDLPAWHLISCRHGMPLNERLITRHLKTTVEHCSYTRSLVFKWRTGRR